MAALLEGHAESLGRTVVVQFSRMNVGTPVKDDAAVMSGKWRLIQNKELYDIGSDPDQKGNVISENRSVANRLQQYYERWWRRVEPGTKCSERTMLTFIGLGRQKAGYAAGPE